MYDKMCPIPTSRYHLRHATTYTSQYVRQNVSNTHSQLMINKAHVILGHSERKNTLLPIAVIKGIIIIGPSRRVIVVA